MGKEQMFTQTGQLKKKTATFHSTMLYPLSCGELAMNGEHILRLYTTSRVYM